MGNLTQEYEQRITNEGEAPSGQTYRWRAPNSEQYAAATGSVPALFNVTDTKAVMTDERHRLNNELNRKLALACVLYPLLVDDSKPGFAEPAGDWLPISRVSQADLNWLGPRILSGAPMDENGTTRRAL